MGADSEVKVLSEATEAKRKGGRVTDRLKEAWSKTRGPMDKNRMRGDVDRGEPA